MTLESSGVVITTQNSSDNYDKTDFGQNGTFSLAKLSASSVASLVKVMDDVFSTGDEVELEIAGGKKVKTRFLKRGDVTELGDSSISIPFDKDAGPGQSASLTLADASTLSVSFDETTEVITIGGITYQSGDTLVLDGKKVTIYDI